MKTFGRLAVAVAVGMAAFAASAGTITYYHNDFAGSPVAATNESGQVIWRESYRPYGERLVNSAAAASNDIWFTSRRQDVETGLVYMGARYYDPVAGRFISPDPLLFNQNNIHSFNRYAYANNNPLRFVDPDGRDAVVINKRNGDIIIEIPILFTGPGANRESIGTIRSQVERAWSGVYELDEKAVSVSVRLVEAEDRGVLNNITLTNGRTSEESIQGASYVLGNNTGEWDVTRLGTDVAAHEAGHLMGLGDRYTAGRDANGNRTTTPTVGAERSIMGIPGGSVGATDMSRILASPINKVFGE